MPKAKKSKPFFEHWGPERRNLLGVNLFSWFHLNTTETLCNKETRDSLAESFKFPKKSFDLFGPHFGAFCLPKPLWNPLSLKRQFKRNFISFFRKWGSYPPSTMREKTNAFLVGIKRILNWRELIYWPSRELISFMGVQLFFFWKIVSQ